eukprot:TRINITY_DN18588_c2_g1_i1.p1 TRINITY_DN18588_c2_g1~~TRINITY_DN18588_c2_g1_i1.p1  ORF type:complete len:959 (+),score=165.56 TRINITY_DN18588_c2_g1_i1:94-2970(+)
MLKETGLPPPTGAGAVRHGRLYGPTKSCGKAAEQHAKVPVSGGSSAISRGRRADVSREQGGAQGCDRDAGARPPAAAHAPGVRAMRGTSTAPPAAAPAKSMPTDRSSSSHFNMPAGHEARPPPKGVDPPESKLSGQCTFGLSRKRRRLREVDPAGAVGSLPPSQQQSAGSGSVHAVEDEVTLDADPGAALRTQSLLPSRAPRPPTPGPFTALRPRHARAARAGDSLSLSPRQSCAPLPPDVVRPSQGIPIPAPAPAAPLGDSFRAPKRRRKCGTPRQLGDSASQPDSDSRGAVAGSSGGSFSFMTSDSFRAPRRRRRQLGPATAQPSQQSSAEAAPSSCGDPAVSPPDRVNALAPSASARAEPKSPVSGASSQASSVALSAVSSSRKSSVHEPASRGSTGSKGAAAPAGTVDSAPRPARGARRAKPAPAPAGGCPAPNPKRPPKGAPCADPPPLTTPGREPGQRAGDATGPKPSGGGSLAPKRPQPSETAQRKPKRRKAETPFKEQPVDQPSQPQPALSSEAAAEAQTAAAAAPPQSAPPQAAGADAGATPGADKTPQPEDPSRKAVQAAAAAEGPPPKGAPQENAPPADAAAKDPAPCAGPSQECSRDKAAKVPIPATQTTASSGSRGASPKAPSTGSSPNGTQDSPRRATQDPESGAGARPPLKTPPRRKKGDQKKARAAKAGSSPKSEAQSSTAVTAKRTPGRTVLRFPRPETSPTRGASEAASAAASASGAAPAAAAAAARLGCAEVPERARALSEVRATHVYTKARGICGAAFWLSNGTMAVLFNDDTIIVWDPRRNRFFHLASLEPSFSYYRTEHAISGRAQVPEPVVPKAANAKILWNIVSKMVQRRQGKGEGLAELPPQCTKQAEPGGLESDDIGPVFPTSADWADGQCASVSLSDRSVSLVTAVQGPKYNQLQWEDMPNQSEESRPQGRTLAVAEGGEEALDIFAADMQ